MISAIIYLKEIARVYVPCYLYARWNKLIANLSMAIVDALKLFTILLCCLASIWPPAVECSSLEKRELAEERLNKRDNATFDCSSSGPCVPCSYSEKSDEKYHCSETGYRMPYKCIEVKSTFKEVNKEQIRKESYPVKDEIEAGMSSENKDTHSQGQQTQKMNGQNDDTEGKDGNWRRLSETTESLEDGKQIHHIFRSCVPAADDEKLSILGFEGIVLCLLLICSPVVYYRKKKSFVISGATRIPTNSRF